MKYRINQILFVLLISFLISTPIFYINRDKQIRLNTDWDASLPTYYFLVDYVREYKSLPSVNPYVSTGIPVIADPTSTTLNPILTPLMVIFGVDSGIKLAYVVSVFLAGLSMLYLLSKLQISGFLRLWGSLVYMTAGHLPAYWASGSVPQFITYPVVPVYLALILEERIRIRNIFFLSLLLTYVLFSGYTYLLWFLTIVTVVVRLYYVFKKPVSFRLNIYFLLFIYAIFILLSTPKLIPYIKEVAPDMQRYFPIDPYLGSIHLYLTPVGFLMPIQIYFYDRPTIQRLLGIHYNWHEYFAFISPFPFLFLFSIKKVLNNKSIVIFLLLLFTGALYMSLAYPYSPFNWIFQTVPFVRNFRVPQRMYVIMTPVMIALLTICAREWFSRSTVYQRRIGIACLVATLISTITVFTMTINNSFVPFRSLEQSIVRRLRESDRGHFYVATVACCLQSFLLQNKMPIINYQGYGWIPKTAPKFLDENALDYDYDLFHIYKPRYILSDTVKQFSTYGYEIYMENDRVRVWKTYSENIIPKL